jgi:hypothetical protein
MTLLLAAANAAHAFLLSDRRLIIGGKIRDHAATKEGFLDASDGRLLYAYTGLAACPGFQTARWLLGAVVKIGESKCEMQDVVEGLKEIATRDFQNLPALRRLSRSEKRLSILFSGYHNGGAYIFAEISNSTDDSGHFAAEARDEFSLRVQIADAPKSGYRVSWHGCIRAVRSADFLSLAELLRADKPPPAIIGKAVELMRHFADVPESCGMIGKDIISGRIQPSIGGWPVAGNFPFAPTTSLHLLDMAVVRPGGLSFGVSDLKMMLPSNAIFDPMPPPNQPCPCRSGRRFKYCHGRKPRR